LHKIDEDGDVQIQANDLKGLEWILKKYLYKLKKENNSVKPIQVEDTIIGSVNLENMNASPVGMPLTKMLDNDIMVDDSEIAIEFYNSSRVSEISEHYQMFSTGKEPKPICLDNITNEITLFMSYSES